MDDEIDIESNDDMTSEDFDAMVQGLTEGLDSIVNTVAPEGLHYVLSVYSDDIERMGVVTNAPPPMAFDMDIDLESLG